MFLQLGLEGRLEVRVQERVGQGSEDCLTHVSPEEERGGSTKISEKPHIFKQVNILRPNARRGGRRGREGISLPEREKRKIKWAKEKFITPSFTK